MRRSCSIYVKFSFLATVPLLAGLTEARAMEVPNPSFEEGVDHPIGWTLSGGQGEWTRQAAQGERAISTTGQAGPGETNYWRTQDLPFEPNTAYRLRFQARRVEGVGGCPITGPVFCNRDLSDLKEEWTHYTSFFVTPREIAAGEAWLRFGQWEVKGTVAYDQIELLPAQPIHVTRGSIVLGEGERIQGNEYLFQTPHRTGLANVSRCLESHHCFFNTYRWVFGKGRDVIYRHRVGDLEQISASLQPSITWYQAGELLIQASRNGQDWMEVGFLDDKDSRSFPLPKELFPGQEIWVRFSSRASTQLGKESDPGSFQVSDYEYRAILEDAPGDLVGNTTFVCVTQSDPRLAATFNALRSPVAGFGDSLVAELENRTDQPIQIEPILRIQATEHDIVEEHAFDPLVLRPGVQHVELEYPVPCFGEILVELSLGEKIDFRAEAMFRVPVLYATGYGHPLPGSSEAVSLWWAESGWKIPRSAVARTGEASPLRIELASNEVEACQLVILPKTDLKNFLAQSQTLRGPGGAAIPASQIEILRVGYVPITQISDEEGCVDLWPDPLPPLKNPIDLEKGKSHPFWVRVRTNQGTPAGIYRGAIQLSSMDCSVEVPLEVTVFGFSLPDRMTLTSAFGMNPSNIFRYHGLTTEEQKREVLDKYFENYSSHHISVYDLAPLDPIQVTWKGQGDWEGGSRDTKVNRSGLSSLRLSDESDTSGANAGFMDLVRIPEQGLRIRLWHKTKEPGQEFLMTLMHHDASRQWMSGRNNDIRRTGDGTWQLIDETIRAFPEGAQWFRFRLWPCLFCEEGSTTGTVWFDDLVLEDAGSGELLAKADFEPLNPAHLQPVLDFTAWDKAMERAIDRHHFNSFNVHLPGMGGGTFHSRYEPNLLGYSEDTPEYKAAFKAYCQTLEEHLEKKGWLDKAYVYWFDEPDPKDYEFVMNGFRKIKENAPGLGRMLTEQVEPELIGGPNIWCPLTPYWDAEATAERRADGDRFWWYICTGPKAPYAGLFIDHAGTELRVWLWQTWKRRIEGILIWETTYWTSSAAYPDLAHPQNPYEDPMGWVSGYSTPSGTKLAWGNGDGRFVYPPEEAACGNPSKPVLEGPVDSIRWEMLRDGIEDYEYMVILDALLNEKGASLSPKKRHDLENLLQVPDEISTSLTHFTKDPKPILDHRRKVARAIERLLAGEI